MINFDDYANENKTEQFRVATYSRSSIQNINSRRLWIWENKCIIKCNIQSTTYCKNIPKNIYVQKTHMEQNINILLTSVKKLD